jgi:hypothetical protein
MLKSRSEEVENPRSTEAIKMGVTFKSRTGKDSCALYCVECWDLLIT